MRVRAGCSFEGPGNIWSKENVEALTEEFPEVQHLPLDRQAMYVRFKLEALLLDFRFFKGNLTPEMHGVLRRAVDSYAQQFLAPPG